MKTRLFRLFSVTVLGLALAQLPGAASAASAIKIVGANTVKVSFADLDLTRTEGVETLYQRLKNAAGQACTQKVGLREVIDVATLKSECVRTALADAVKSIDNELLRQLHQDSNNS